MKNNFSYSILKSSKNSYANRGMGLESDINLANEYYRIKDIAYIYKKPTPIKLVKVDYTKGKIHEAYFETPSTTDYNGIFKGKYIDFEAKETVSKTSFALSNIHAHQIKHLINVKNKGAISFIIIRFSTLDKTYLLETNILEEFINTNDRKSIPYDYIKEYGYELKIKYNPRIDYLEVIDKLYFGGNNNG